DLAVIRGNDSSFETAVWAKAEAVITVTKPDTALAITIEYTGDPDGALWPYLDNVVIEKVPAGNTTITIHHDVDSTTEQITLPNKTFVNEIVSSKIIEDKRLEGFYTDNTYTTRANGIVLGKTELWAKWNKVPSKVENTYDEPGLSLGKLSGNNIFHFGTKTAATPNITKVVQFNPVSGQVELAKGNFTYVEIYDPNADFSSFITKPDTDYKINFDFKVKSGTYGDTSFNIREVVNGKVGKIIGTAATVVKGDKNYSDYTWGKAEAVVAITKPDTALAISIESTLNDNANLYPYLDNIVVDRVKDRQTVDITINNYKNDGTSKTVTISKNALFTQIELDAVSGMNFMGLYTDKNFKNAAKGKIGDSTVVWAKWRDANIFDNSYDEPGLTKEKLKGKDITFLGTRESSGHEGKVLQFNKIAGQNSITESADNITRVEIYNPDSSEFESFVPETNATYYISFDYKQKSTKSDIRFNIREVIDGKVGEILGNAAVIKGNDPKFTTAVWARAEAVITVTKPNTTLAITIEYTGASDGSLWPYLDNVEIDKIPSPSDKKELIIHKFDGTNDKKIELPNATLFSDIEIPNIFGKKYEGLYFDKEFTKPVEGVIYRHNEVWAKWRTADDADKIVNTYDDDGVYYKEDYNLDRFDEEFKLTEAEEKKANNYITRYSDSGLKNAIDSAFKYPNFAIGSFAEGRSGNAIQLNSASVTSVTKPPLVKIYDNRDGNKTIYKPRPNTLYKIEFYVKSTQLVSKDMHIAVKGYSDQANTFGTGSFFKYCFTIKNGTVVKDWVKVETYFTVPDAQFDFLGVSLMASGTAAINGKNAETEAYNVQVSIDDISITEVFDTYYLTADPNNGDKSFKITFKSGELLDTIPTVKRNGYVFAGWFTDAELKTPFTYGKMPAEYVNIYGKWEKLADSAYNFSTGFEKGDFSVSYPYTNTEDNKLYSNNMSSAVTVVTNPDDVHDDGEKYLHFEIDPASSRQTMDMAAVALLNPDGTAFQVVKGTRYTIDFSLRCDTDCYIVPVISDQTPTGKLNLSNSTEINRTWFRPYWYHNKNEWGTMKNVFVPNTSGRVYLLVYYGSTYVDIDNVEINCATNKEVVQVKFYNEKGTGVKKTVTGRVGDWLFPPIPAAKEGYVFDGWYDALGEDGKVYAKSVLPGEDIKLYPRYRIATPEGDNPPTVKEDGIMIDFEGDNARKLAFYQSNNDCWIGNNDALFVVDDSKGAHSGSNYFKFNNAGQWTASEYRRFRFYNEDTSDNRVYLEPLSVYKVGFWMKVDRTWSAAMRIVAFDTTDTMGVISNQQVVALTEVETEEDYGKWIYYEGELTTGSDICTAGIMISGGFLTASIDDITVRKMKKLVVSFDSLGGTPVESLETYENQYVVAPIDPEKEGYYFGGWYTEKDMKNL
ncbi:MAG: InlB B-repeat-containing protein, partial [Clostridia bacterium]|nr:InlB B-repeat-containing protein [Clostridia bacterium]